MRKWYLTTCTNATAVLTHSFGETTHFALLNSGASDSYIILDVVRGSRLKLLPLEYTTNVRVVNGQTLNVGYLVRVRATIGGVHVRLFLRVIDTPLPIVLCYPFLHQFNPLINWKHRTVQIIHKRTTHIIPVVNAYGNPNTPMAVVSAVEDLRKVQNTADPIQQLPTPTPQHVMAQKAILLRRLTESSSTLPYTHPGLVYTVVLLSLPSSVL